MRERLEHTAKEEDMELDVRKLHSDFRDLLGATLGTAHTTGPGLGKITRDKTFEYFRALDQEMANRGREVEEGVGEENERSDSYSLPDLTKQQRRLLVNLPADFMAVNDDWRYKVHEYFGDEFSQRILDLQNVPPTTSVPSLKTQLKPWQATGAAKINFCCNGPERGCILGDGMGLGRTLTSLASCAMNEKEGEPYTGFNLILTTSTCLNQWKSEVSLNFDKKKTIILTDHSMGAMQLLEQRPVFVITTYQFVVDQLRRRNAHLGYRELILRRGKAAADNIVTMNHIRQLPTLSLFSDIYRYLTGYMGIKRLIVDRAQNVKNLSSQIHQAIKELRYESIILISDTFIANRWDEIYGLIDLMPCKPFPSVHHFHHVFSAKGGTEIARFPDLQRKDVLIKYLMSFTIARPASLLQLPNAKKENIRATDEGFFAALRYQDDQAPKIPHIDVIYWVIAGLEGQST
ncbi:hypothetical protein DIS24_g11055 [Lasiodiplodia hormozganensis]|uniref:Helicase ATP-binding domain-containing protein n=1 Tax=Lasiodiplodia hormozganensis TaxID=869390 RepID=A0AA39X1L2_9PEZI|nr:hypothetical protein DIS24_g11055 [Lasiodiplodia hormozganensis]